MNKIKQYLLERAKWNKFSKPIRSQEEIDKIFNTCIECEYFERRDQFYGNCGICGCYIKQYGLILNKAAWGTTRCPLNNPKWIEDKPEYSEDSSFSEEEINKAEIQHEIDSKKITRKNNKSIKNKNCGCSK